MRIQFLIGLFVDMLDKQKIWEDMPIHTHSFFIVQNTTVMKWARTTILFCQKGGQDVEFYCLCKPMGRKRKGRFT